MAPHDTDTHNSLSVPSVVRLSTTGNVPSGNSKTKNKKEKDISVNPTRLLLYIVRTRFPFIILI